MADAANLDEYNRLQHARMRISGFGSDVTMSTPCPFCCAPDVAVYRVLEVGEHMKREHVCNECARAYAYVVTQAQGGIQFEIVQTRGSDPPSYLPRMRRIDGVTS
jgi:hypothetical protein